MPDNCSTKKSMINSYSLAKITETPDIRQLYELSSVFVHMGSARCGYSYRHMKQGDE
jgi:hypothetical protein